MKKLITRKSKLEEKEKEFLVKVSIKIGKDLIEQDLEESLSIPMADNLTLPIVLKILSESPILHARWNILYNEAVYEYDVLKTKSEIWMSKKSTEYRKELEKVSKGRVTDKMVEEMIKTDPDYEKINDDLAQSKKNMKHIFAIANGLGERGDKIVTIASMLKWEAENIGGNKFSASKKEYPHIKRDFEEKNNDFNLNVNDGWPT